MTYITFEGGEGSGKSTQAQLLAKRLPDAVVTREPGATILGKKLRSILLDGLDSDTSEQTVEAQSPTIGPQAEALLMAADRAQHLIEVIHPALAANKQVISDRSVYSSMAYQGAGRQLGVEHVRQLNNWVVEKCWPDIVVLLDIDRATANNRLQRPLDRLEQQGDQFHERILTAYREMAAADRNRWIVVSAAGSVQDVASRVWDAIAPLLTADPENSEAS